MCRKSTVSSDNHLEIGREWSTSVILIILCTVYLQFQDWFVPISLRGGIVTAYVMATVWSPYS